ncbi:MAG: hypothetical protein A3K19_30835 [Lentisphaerae bacterium RIFOXYB12_FULL_65_16]|nr:MAG: hypothetical protein A3K18_04060 [Lentisphaerae bacterium RIFOXYA12_64_32]OGV88814.1 MAG: hypothetical protein A3K19_30835 [Lentisphaerae bacterium RIFOXYB12_FULL_65_16]
MTRSEFVSAAVAQDGRPAPETPGLLAGRHGPQRGRLAWLCAIVALLFGTGPLRAQTPAELELTARDPNGHGLLCRFQKKTILIVDGTPEQIGTAHGTLLRDGARKLMERVVFGVGTVWTFEKAEWFPDRMAEVQRRAAPHIPERFIRECDALAKAADMPPRCGLYANLFPEMFHCSGVAVRGKATSDGSVIHARVLDYMSDIGLQRQATIQVFMPDGYNAWISAGYAGFVGTVTAMNAKGLAIGEMGGRGEGQWDGMPMTLLLRDIMERAATVAEALKMIQDTPRTCEYYYVISDKSKDVAAVYCTPAKVEILHPGQQHPELPPVPEDTVYVSGGKRAECLGQRLRDAFGKIDVPAMIEIVKRPVAMRSNLHTAIMKPETLEIWIADAGKRTPACDEPYVRVCLTDLISFYEKQKTPPAAPSAPAPAPKP